MTSSRGGYGKDDGGERWSENPEFQMTSFVEFLAMPTMSLNAHFAKIWDRFKGFYAKLPFTMKIFCQY